MVKCEICEREFEEGKTHEHPKKAHEHSGKVYVHEGKVVCESCLVDAGIPVDQAEPYFAHIKRITDARRGGIGI